MSDDNVKDLPLRSDATQRLVIAAIEKYVAAMTPPSDQAEKQLWDQVVQTKLHAHTMSVNASGMPVTAAHSVKDAVTAANDVITERRRYRPHRRPYTESHRQGPYPAHEPGSRGSRPDTVRRQQIGLDHRSSSIGVLPGLGLFARGISPARWL